MTRAAGTLAVCSMVLAGLTPQRAEAVQVTWVVSGTAYLYSGPLPSSLAEFVDPSPFVATIRFESTAPKSAAYAGPGPVGLYETALLEVRFESGALQYEFPLSPPSYIGVGANSLTIFAGDLVSPSFSTQFGDAVIPVAPGIPIVPPRICCGTTGINIWVSGSNPDGTYYAITGGGGVTYSVPEPGVVALPVLLSCLGFIARHRGQA